jgi:hypothetical protein
VDFEEGRTVYQDRVHKVKFGLLRLKMRLLTNERGRSSAWKTDPFKLFGDFLVTKSFLEKLLSLQLAEIIWLGDEESNLDSRSQRGKGARNREHCREDKGIEHIRKIQE